MLEAWRSYKEMGFDEKKEDVPLDDATVAMLDSQPNRFLHDASLVSCALAVLASFRLVLLFLGLLNRVDLLFP
jgi:hypothetical protein